MNKNQRILADCETAFRKAGIHDAYYELKLDKILSEPKSVEDVSLRLGLSNDAMFRFLNTTTYLEITDKIDSKYVHTGKKRYTKEPTEILIWLIENEIPNLILSGNIRANEINSSKLQKAVDYHLIRQDEQGRYSIIQELKDFICKSGVHYIGPKLKHYQEIMYPTFDPKTIIAALKENKSQWNLISGDNATTAFDIYDAKPELLEIFTHAMHDLNKHDNQAVIKEITIKRDAKILDVGGGSGALALAILEQNPTLEIDIYEHHSAIDLMKRVLKNKAPKNKINKINYISGDFTKDGYKSTGLYNLEKKYDIIFLAWILHDWNDKDCIDLIKKIATHLVSSGTLIILEEIMPENRIAKTCLSDMTMLLHTEGIERTLSDYKSLLTLSGFNNSDIHLSESNTRRQALLAQRR